MADKIEYGREEWKRRDPDAAYAEAERRVDWALAHPEEPWLFLSDLFALRRLPDALARCTHLERFDIGNERGPDGKYYGGARVKVIEGFSTLAPLTHLRQANLNQTELAELTQIAGATALQSLKLWGTRVSDLSPIAGATDLRSLDLRGTEVSDLSPIGGTTSLDYLDLSHTKVSDLAPLAGATALQSLNLRETRVNNLAPIAGATQLRYLSLWGTGVSNLAPIAGATALQHLELTGTEVTDLRPIAGATALKHLDISGTKVSDLSPIAGATALHSLNIGNTKVSDLSFLLDLPDFVAGNGRIYFGGTPLARSNARWDKIAESEGGSERCIDVIALLREEAAQGPTDRGAADRPFVFISYKRENLDQASALRVALGVSGVTAWWDQAIPPSANYREEIRARLEAASAVISLWSAEGVGSDWLQDEAQRGLNRGRLIQATLDGTQPLPPFGARQLTDLSGWDLGANHPGVRRIVAEAKRLCGHEDTEADERRALQHGAAQKARIGLDLDDAARPKLVDAPPDARHLYERSPAAAREVAIQLENVRATVIALEGMEANASKTLLPRLKEYRNALEDDEPSLIRVTPRWRSVKGFISDNIERGSFDRGILDSFDAALDQHPKVDEALAKSEIDVGEGAGPEDDVDAVPDQEIADAVSDGLDAVDEVEEEINPNVAWTLRGYFEQIEANRTAPYGEEKAAAELRHQRYRGAVLGATGTIGLLGSLSSLSGYTAPRAVEVMIEKLAPIWDILSKIFL